MASYSDIVPDRLELTRNPKDSGYAPRAWDKALLRIEDGSARIVSREYYGGDGVPVREWNNEILTYALASSEHGETMLDVGRLRADLEDGGDLAVLIDRIIAGHTVEWNGDNDVGRLTEDARDASDQLQMIEPYERDTDD